MKTREVDVAVIGAGTAGLTARRAAARHGAQRVVLIENGPYGTTCARVGCMPSKLLIAASEAAHRMREAHVFGVRCGDGPQIDGPAVLRRVRRERDRFVASVLRTVEEIPAEDRIRGTARFLGPTTLQVDGSLRIEARAIVLATGSRPWTPPPYRALGDRLLTSDTLFELPDLPAAVAVVGTGVIALELGQALHRLGVRVAFYNRYEEVGVLREPRMQEVARSVLGEELDLRLGIRGVRAERSDQGVRLHWTDASGSDHRDEFDLVLSAAGRRPNVAALELERAGIELDEHGVPRFDPRTMQCGTSPIFVAGDADGQRQVLHEAADEGRIAGENAGRFPEVLAHVRRTELAIVFTDPQMAVVGPPVQSEDPSIAAGEVDYGDQGRARVMNEQRGRVRIYASSETGELRGAEMLGPRVEHTAHLLAWAVAQHLTVQAALEMPFYHPVLEEGIRSALRDLAANLRLRGPTKPLEGGPGT